jgi:UPF0271 protein
MEIDLNADLGEGTGFDAELMTLITSANVCCGRHAGEPSITAETLQLARQHGVTVGAHPGYPDREHFGRRELDVAEYALWAECTFQIGGLIGLAKAEDAPVRYVKPHGALYNQACRDRQVARCVVTAASHYDLPVVGLPGSALATEATTIVPFIPEGFADRRYRPDGTLVPRSEPDAFVEDPEEAVRQVEWLIRDTGVRTICVHGDNPKAVSFIRAVRTVLLDRGFTLKSFA